LNDKIHDTTDLFHKKEPLYPFIRRLGGPLIRF
jgi:hypothetical protein